MKDYHVSDELLQEYAMNESIPDGNDLQHIAACTVCELKIQDYRSLMSSVATQEIPSFDFDVAATVLARLPVEKKKANDTKLIGMLVFMAMLIIFIPGYIFRDYLLKLINKSMITLFGIIGVAAIIIVIVQAVDMYKSYQQRMNQLNLY